MGDIFGKMVETKHPQQVLIFTDSLQRMNRTGMVSYFAIEFRCNENPTRTAKIIQLHHTARWQTQRCSV